VSVSEKWKDRLTDQLCKALLSLKSEDEAYRFLEDVATIGEIIAFAQRLEVARLLYEGNNYPQVVQKTGASTATISRAKNLIEHGADGFTLVLERLAKKEKEEGKS
jgi:TrpR-related protein YerC/YecD